MFKELCSLLDHSDSNLPAGRVVVVRDCVAIDGSFVLYHYVSLFHRAGGRCLLVAMQHSFAHYEVVLAKFGVQLRSAVNGGHIKLVDVGRSLGQLNGDEPRSLVDDLTTTIGRWCIAEDQRPLLVLLDGLSVLGCIGAPPSSQCELIVRCLAAVRQYGCLVLRLLNGAEHLPVNALCCQLADDLVDVLPLETGPGRDVHCQVQIRQKIANKPLVISHRLLVRLHERNVHFFSPGQLPRMPV